MELRHDAAAALKQQITPFVADMRDELVDLTADLIRFRTLRLEGSDFEPCVRYLARRLESAGFEVDVIRVPDEEIASLARPESHYRALGLTGPIAPRFNAIAHRRGTGGGPSLHLNGHYCVVETGPGWSRDPFDPVVREGRIFGRGACDMKSGLAMIVGAVTALDRLGFDGNGDIYVSLTLDTHLSGDLGAGFIARKGLGKADRVIVGDTSGVGRIITGYRGQLWVEITTEGRTAHGSAPFYGRSAVEDMSFVIQRLIGLRAELDRQTSAYTDIVPEQARHPTIAIGTQINGGTWLNTVAAECTLTVDRRLIPEETPQQAFEEIEQAVAAARRDSPGMSVTVRNVFSAPPAVTSPSDPLVRILASNIDRVRGEPATTLIHPAFLDLRWFASEWKVPVAVYSPGDGGAGTGFQRRPYAEPDESVSVADLVDATTVLAMSIAELTDRDDS